MSRIERKKQASEEIKSEDNAEKKNNNADDVNDTDLPSAGVKEKNIFKRFKNWFTGLKTWKKVVFISVIALLVILIAGGIIVYAYFNSIFEEIHEPTPEDYDLSLTAVDGYYNILLLGVDSRDMDNFDETRSDAIMMVSINEETSDVKLLSVYRDTYLKMGDTSTYDKITHACFYGGPELTMKTLNQAMDLNISNYVVVNFKAVADLVDAVGGIEVDVQDYEISELNKYTIETAENIGCDDYQLVEEAGVQTLEGVQAVSYGRIRKGVGDDFKRTERMQTVISLVMDKMKDMSFNDLTDIIKMMTPQVRTNLSRNDILGLAIRLPQYNIVDTTGWPYNISTGYIGGISYVFPSNLADNVIQLHQEFFEQEDYAISSTVSSISSAIAQNIEAARQSNELTEEETEVKPNEDNDTSTTPDEDTEQEAPAEPSTPDTPDTPSQPSDTEQPETPDTPTEPETPDTPTEPSNPEEPSNPTDSSNSGQDSGSSGTSGNAGAGNVSAAA